MKDDRKLLYISDYTEDLIFANSQDIANKLSLKKRKFIIGKNMMIIGIS